MAIESHVFEDHGVTVLVHAGEIPDEEFLAFYESFFEGDGFDPAMNLLVDLRDADSSLRSSGVLRRFAEYMRATRTDVTNRTKVAVVAPQDVSFGLARMYEVLAGSVPWDFVVFRALDAALAWLGLPEDALDH